MRRALAAEESSLPVSPAPSYAALARSRRSRIPRLWAESPLCHPCASPPRGPHLGHSSGQIFPFFYFGSCRPGQGSFARETAPSLSRGRARQRQAPPPCSYDLPHLLLAPALPSCVPSFLTPPTPLGPNDRPGGEPESSGVRSLLRSGPCSSRAGTQDLCLHDWAELFPALTRRPGALAGPGEGFPAQAAAGGNEARLPQAGHSGPAGGAASMPRGELFLSSARREDLAARSHFSERLIRDPDWVSETWTGGDERGEG